MHCFYTENIDENEARLGPLESQHLFKVLRKSKGAAVLITDGKGFLYNGVVTKSDQKEAIISNLELRRKLDEGRPKIHLAIAPPKRPQRLEWLIEKAIEVGLDRLSLLICKRSEKSRWKMERLRMISISAMKQSLYPQLLTIDEPMDFSTFLEAHDQSVQSYICQFQPSHKDLRSTVVSGKSVLYLVGPEGDFTDEEYQMALDRGFIGVNISENRLRTETAALVALTTLRNRI